MFASSLSGLTGADETLIEKILNLLKPFDKLGDWQVYARNALKTREERQALIDFLCPDDMSENENDLSKWLTFSLFKIIVDNIRQCQQVMPRLLHYCFRNKVFEGTDHARRIESFFENVFALNQYGYELSNTNFDIAFKMSELRKAILVCHQNDFIDMAVSEVNTARRALLLGNLELIRAGAVLFALKEKRGLSVDEITRHLKTLFADAARENSTELQASNARFYKTDQMHNLTARVKHIMESHGMSADGNLAWKLGFE